MLLPSPQPFWTVHPFDCQHVTIRNIDIWNPAHSPNTDGVDPDSCSDVLIENCAIAFCPARTFARSCCAGFFALCLYNKLLSFFGAHRKLYACCGQSGTTAGTT